MKKEARFELLLPIGANDPPSIQINKIWLYLLRLGQAKKERISPRAGKAGNPMTSDQPLRELPPSTFMEGRHKAPNTQTREISLVFLVMAAVSLAFACLLRRKK